MILRSRKGNIISITQSRRKQIRKKRKKTTSKRSRKKKSGKKDRKIKRFKLRSVLFDTNVLISGIGKKTSPDTEIIKTAKSKNRMVYTQQIANEIKPKKASTPEEEKRLNLFKKKNRHKVVKVRSPTAEQLSEMPGDGKDKMVAYQAKQAGVEDVVTRDDRFRKKLIKSKLFTVFSPLEYALRRMRK